MRSFLAPLTNSVEWTVLGASGVLGRSVTPVVVQVREQQKNSELQATAKSQFNRQGEKRRMRQCDDPEPENGGAGCVGEPSQESACVIKVSRQGRLELIWNGHQNFDLTFVGMAT